MEDSTNLATIVGTVPVPDVPMDQKVFDDLNAYGKVTTLDIVKTAASSICRKFFPNYVSRECSPEKQKLIKEFSMPYYSLTTGL